MLFCLDTSALVEAWHTWYPVDVFPKLWEDLSSAAGQGELIAPEIVLEELRRKEDKVLRWSKAHVVFVALDEQVQVKQAEIVNRFPKLIELRKGRSLADPWVVAVAAVKGCPVVSMEKPGGKTPKIPDVCLALGIEHLAFIDMVRRFGWAY